MTGPVNQATTWTFGSRLQEVGSEWPMMRMGQQKRPAWRNKGLVVLPGDDLICVCFLRRVTHAGENDVSFGLNRY